MVYDISYKTFFGSKPLHIRFDKVDGFIRVYDGVSYLVLFVPEKYDVITRELDILLVKKAALHMFFLIIMQKLKFIFIILNCKMLLYLLDQFLINTA